MTSKPCPVLRQSRRNQSISILTGFSRKKNGKKSYFISHQSITAHAFIVNVSTSLTFAYAGKIRAGFKIICLFYMQEIWALEHVVKMKSMRSGGRVVKMSASQPKIVSSRFQNYAALRPWFLVWHQLWFVPGSGIEVYFSKFW